jgi:two-component system response regulator
MGQPDKFDILLVEDDPADAELAVRALRKGNIPAEIAWVKDGAEALEYLFRDGAYAGRTAVNPQLILLDLKLPKVNGIEVLRRVKGDERTQAIPVVMVTSSAERRDVAESYRLGVNSYVVKPLDYEQFSATVATTGHYWTRLNRPLD